MGRKFVSQGSVSHPCGYWAAGHKLGLLSPQKRTTACQTRPAQRWDRQWCALTVCVCRSGSSGAFLGQSRNTPRPRLTWSMNSATTVGSGVLMIMVSSTASEKCTIQAQLPVRAPAPRMDLSVSDQNARVSTRAARELSTRTAAPCAKLSARSACMEGKLTDLWRSLRWDAVLPFIDWKSVWLLCALRKYCELHQ